MNDPWFLKTDRNNGTWYNSIAIDFNVIYLRVLSSLAILGKIAKLHLNRSYFLILYPLPLSISLAYHHNCWRAEFSTADETASLTYFPRLRLVNLEIVKYLSFPIVVAQYYDRA